MITVVADTHGTDDHRLVGRTLEAVREADLVVHAGDFTTETVLDAFEAETERLVGVIGNNATAGVRDRLPARATVEHAGVRILLVHGHEHDDTALSLLGRENEADLVISGHSHRPGFENAGPVCLLNPGSHAEPRWHRPAHAELDAEADRVVGRLCEPDGTVFERFEFAVDS